MQKIIHSEEYQPLSRLFDEIELFYAYTSEKTLQSQHALVKPTFDNALKPLQSLFNKYGDNSYDFLFKDKKYKPLELPEYDKSNIILCFSGGKDSTAVATRLLNLGYNVYLYHMLGINKAYTDEWKQAEEIANYLNLPIYFDEVKVSGNSIYLEHPMKNMIIVNGALQFGIQNNLGIQVMTGNFLDGELNKYNFSVCGGDLPEFWDVYDELIQTIIPDFYIQMALSDLDETLEILSEDMKLLEMCQSCIGAQRFRKWNHDNNEKKYGIKLLKNRCGSCWKCAIEYIYLADHDKTEYNPNYYKHCLMVLKKIAKREHGAEFTQWEDLWYSYFSYDIKESKYLGG